MNNLFWRTTGTTGSHNCMRQRLAWIRWLMMVVLCLVGYMTRPVGARGSIKCGLPCVNGGVCKEGVAPLMITNTTSGATMATAAARTARYDYCHCPSGYSGEFCQVKFQPCPATNDADQNSTLCSNGALCIRDVDHEGKVYYHCECDDTVTDYSTVLARRTCQHASTVFCTAKFNRNSLGQAAGAYCLNGGTCMAPAPPRNGTHHHTGCNCPENIWKGAHCEVSADVSLAAKYHYYDSDNEKNEVSYSYQQQQQPAVPRSLLRRVILSGCTAVGVAMLLGLAYVMYDTHRQNSYNQRRRKERAACIPKEIGVGTKKTSANMRNDKQGTGNGGPRFEPLEIEEPEISASSDLEQYRDNP